MKALLLAAGLGTRLRPLTNTIPKCMVPVRGRPLLDYWLDLLLSAGIEQLLVNTHYLPDVVREFVRSSQWKARIKLAHEDHLLGTGGTILKNRAFLEKDAFLVAHADNLTQFDVNAFLGRHQNRPVGAEITMMTFDTDAPHTCGIVEEDSHGMVIAFHEKVTNPPGIRANAAVYILEPSVINFLGTLGKEVIDLSTEVIPRFLGRICTFHNAGYHRDIGTPESLLKAEAEFIKQ